MKVAQRAIAALVVLLVVALAAGCRRADMPRALGIPEQAYQAHCAVCHGDLGAGDGPLSSRLARDGSRPTDLSDPRTIQRLGWSGVRNAIAPPRAARRSTCAVAAWGPYLGGALVDSVAKAVFELPGARTPTRRAIARYLEPPRGSDASGRATYVHYCSGCHGPHGYGDGLIARRMLDVLRPPRLRDSRTFVARTDRELRALLAQGSGHAEHAATMPGWINTLDSTRVDALVSYLRVISGTPRR